MGDPMAEVEINDGLVRRLLSEQCPGWADLEVALVAEGWDNVG